MLARPLSHWLLLMTLMVLWGSSFALTRLAVADLPPAVIVWSRNLLAVAVLLISVAVYRRRHRADWPRGVKLWGFMLGVAIFGNLLPFSLISWGQQYIDSALAGILMAFMPLLTLMLAHLLVPGERMNAANLVGFVIGFLGVVVLIGPTTMTQIGGGVKEGLGQLAVLAAAVCYAINTLMARLKPASHPLTTSVGLLAMATLLGTPLALATLWLPDITVTLSWPAVVAVILLGALSTGLASIVFFTLVTQAGPTFFSLINYLIPCWAVMVGALFMGESLTLNQWAGLVIILAGVGVSQRR